MLRYDPSKRPSAAECLQHPFFQVRLPIPLSMSSGEKEEEVKKAMDEKTQDLEASSQFNELKRTDENIDRPKKIKITSKELMENARYRPGVKPLTIIKKD